MDNVEKRVIIILGRDKKIELALDERMSFISLNMEHIDIQTEETLDFPNCKIEMTLNSEEMKRLGEELIEFSEKANNAQDRQRQSCSCM